MNMGKTRRHHGRENGEDAKFHRWWRKNEGDWSRNDHDRHKVQTIAKTVAIHEGVNIKSRKTKNPPNKTLYRYRTQFGKVRPLSDWELENAGKTSRFNHLDW
jgi:hypothetical protein